MARCRRRQDASTNVSRKVKIKVHVWKRARKDGNPDYLIDIKEKPNLSVALHYAGVLSAGAGVRCDIMIDGVREYRVWRSSADKILVSRNGKNVPYEKLIGQIAKGIQRANTRTNRKRDNR